jgi:pimeloyl-ACP methyl ester carboxylesterase
MPTAKVNGVKLNYELAGAGKPIVMLHGYIGDLEDWRNQIGHFSQKYQVAALDQRGRGKSATPQNDSAYSMDIFVEDVYRWLKMLKIEKCCLMGHSLGGMVALSFVIAHPEMVGALIIADSNSEGQPVTPEITALREKEHAVALKQGSAAAWDYDLAHNPGTQERYRQHPETMARMRRKYETTSPYGFINVWQAMFRWPGVTPRLGEVAVPTLIVYADADLPFVLAGAEPLHQRIKGSELVLIKNSSHGPMYEKPVEFNQVIEKFLNIAHPDFHDELVHETEKLGI